jgi:hypothetical protein
LRAKRAKYACPHIRGRRQPEEGERKVKVFQQETQLRTSGGLSVRDITEEVIEVVRESGVVDGIA